MVAWPLAEDEERLCKAPRFLTLPRKRRWCHRLKACRGPNWIAFTTKIFLMLKPICRLASFCQISSLHSQLQQPVPTSLADPRVKPQHQVCPWEYVLRINLEGHKFSSGNTPCLVFSKTMERAVPVSASIVRCLLLICTCTLAGSTERFFTWWKTYSSLLLPSSASRSSRCF